MTDLSRYQNRLNKEIDKFSNVLKSRTERLKTYKNDLTLVIVTAIIQQCSEKIKELIESNEKLYQHYNSSSGNTQNMAKIKAEFKQDKIKYLKESKLRYR